MSENKINGKESFVCSIIKHLDFTGGLVNFLDIYAKILSMKSLSVEAIVTH